MKISGKSTTGELVTKNAKFASVFNKYEIDFCCNGGNTLQAACAILQIDVQLVMDELNQLSELQGMGIMGYEDWPLDLLCDYIEKTHHRYVKEKSEDIEKYLDKVCQVHGEEMPGIIEVKTLFKKGSIALREHMDKEESVLFPYIRQMVDSREGETQILRSSFYKLKEVVQCMEEEHKVEGERLRNIAKLIAAFAPDSDLCNTFLVSIKMLNEFDENLKTHIHLENNILFPKAIALAETIHIIES